MIRRAHGGDLLTLLDLERKASSTALAHIFGPDRPFPVEDVLARWRIVLDDPRLVTAVDEDESGPVGYAAYGDGWLRHFGCLPRLWGSGRADALHEVVLAGLSSQGARSAYLWVLVDNHRARSFYARRGWLDTQVREREVFAPFPEKMQMVRDLPPPADSGKSQADTRPATSTSPQSAERPATRNRSEVAPGCSRLVCSPDPGG